MHQLPATGTMIVFLILVAGLWTPVLAHGPAHQGPTKGTGHLQAMQRVKENIPEEYRVMDRTPVNPSATSLARGKELYREHCGGCHGAGGKGDGPAAAGMDPRPANFLDREHSSFYGPGEKYWLIGDGSGETGMPGFGQLSPLDRWHLVNHILSLQQRMKIR